MCSWERFCAFAREPERRTVAGDATVAVEGASYEVEPELAGETVTLLWGLFDQALFVEHGGKRYGPFEPSRCAVPRYRYRKHQKSRAEERLDKVVRLADQLGLPRAALTGGDRPLPSLAAIDHGAERPPDTVSRACRGNGVPDRARGTARHRRPDQAATRLAARSGPGVHRRPARRDAGQGHHRRSRARAAPEQQKGDKLMLADVQSSYGLARPFQGAGNFETEHQRTIVR